MKIDELIARLNYWSQVEAERGLPSESNDLAKAAETIRLLWEIPAADVVEVVRCKDCVHYDKGANDSESWMYCTVLAKNVYDDFYCKLGRRREVQDDD